MVYRHALNLIEFINSRGALPLYGVLSLVGAIVENDFVYGNDSIQPSVLLHVVGSLGSNGFMHRRDAVVLVLFDRAH